MLLLLRWFRSLLAPTTPALDRREAPARPTSGTEGPTPQPTSRQRSSPPNRPEQQAAAPPDAHEAITTALSGLGVVRDTVLTNLINPAFMGQARWPALRQAYRVVDLDGGGVALATDGIADPDESGHSLGIEFWSQSREAGENGPGWLLNMVKGVGDLAAQTPRLPGMLEHYGHLTVSLHPQMLGQASPTWRDADGGISVLIGLEVPGVPASTSSPPIRLANVTLLRPSEVAYARTSPDALAVLCDKLLETPAALVNDLERPAVV